jgi:hypothetical protein
VPAKKRTAGLVGTSVCTFLLAAWLSGGAGDQQRPVAANPKLKPTATPNRVPRGLVTVRPTPLIKGTRPVLAAPKAVVIQTPLMATGPRVDVSQIQAAPPKSVSVQTQLVATGPRIDTNSVPFAPPKHVPVATPLTATGPR